MRSLHLLLIIVSAVPALARNDAYQARRNTVSRIDFLSTNYGTFSFGPDLKDAGVYWPRGSSNKYILGAGLWFGAKKKPRKPDTLAGYIEYSFYTDNGRSWMVPGRIEEGDTSIPGYAPRNRILSSGDFDSGGRPLDSNAHVPWPVWDTDYGKRLGSENYFGNYVYEPASRERSIFLKGPAFLSDEDIFSSWKDTDTGRITNTLIRKQYSIPLRMQYEESIYSWKPGTPALEDILVLRYKAINRSADTLPECWIGWVSDIDIYDTSNHNTHGFINNRGRYLSEYDSLQAGAFWWENTRGDINKALGYLGVCLLESPAVGQAGFLRRDKSYFPESEQLGIKTFTVKGEFEDLPQIRDLYLIISSGSRYAEKGPDDIRLHMSTGPFHMLPGDTICFAIGLVFAKPKFPEQSDKRGTGEDMDELLGKIVAARKWYNSDKDLPRDTIPISTEENPLTVYPHPVTGNAVANIFLSESSFLNVQLYDMLGRSMQLYSGEGRRGENIIPLDAQAMSPGSYFLVLNYNGKRVSSPFLILR